MCLRSPLPRSGSGAPFAVASHDHENRIVENHVPDPLAAESGLSIHPIRCARRRKTLWSYQQPYTTTTVQTSSKATSKMNNPNTPRADGGGGYGGG